MIFKVATMLLLATKVAAESGREFLAPDSPITSSHEISHEVTQREMLQAARANLSLLAKAQLAEVADMSGSAYQAMVIQALISWVLFMIIALIVVHTCYKRGLPNEKDDDFKGNAKHTLESGHFGCFEDSYICFCSCCCMAIRWSDTISHAGLHAFWTAFALFALFGLLNDFTYGGFFFGIFTCALMTYCRQQLREKFGLPHFDVATVVIDCCYICWCPCCAVAQEARAVKEAYLAGKPQLEPAEEEC